MIELVGALAHRGAAFVYAKTVVVEDIDMDEVRIYINKDTLRSESQASQVIRRRNITVLLQNISSLPHRGVLVVGEESRALTLDIRNDMWDVRVSEVSIGEAACVSPLDGYHGIPPWYFWRRTLCCCVHNVVIGVQAMGGRGIEKLNRRSKEAVIVTVVDGD